MGVSYNSYVILDEKIAVMDSVDARAAVLEWLSNVFSTRRCWRGMGNPDYLVVTHMEPDHSGSLMRIAQEYPEMKIVGNVEIGELLNENIYPDQAVLWHGCIVGRPYAGGWRKSFPYDLSGLTPAALCLLAPMVHWPEVMTAYEETEKTPVLGGCLRPLLFTGTDCPCPLGAAGPTVLLQYYREIWRTGAGSAEKDLRAGDQNDLPAPWSRAYRRAGGVSAAL